ncbi:glycosyltransferase family 2 protein [Microbispora rosea]|uniref:glycosyltransferase family 2 protein n=1 Tax=Microbispora rosea TaxID=58117 RepID=UPI00341ADF66
MTGKSVLSLGVSVVVPVRGRVAAAERMLASVWAAAARCPEPVEVLLVDDSGPEDAARHREQCDRNGARYLRGPRHAGAKCNLGARHASHDLLLFLGSDCRASPGLLRRYVKTIRMATGTAGLAGPTVVMESPTAVSRIMRRSPLLHGDLKRPAAGDELEWAATSNLLLRRTAFEAVGGFAERSPTVVAGEDVDLGIRLTWQGFTLRAEPDAEVVQDRLGSESVRSVSRRLYRHGRSQQWLAVVHPDRRVPRCNPVAAVGAATVAALAAAPATRGRSMVLIPATAALTLGLRARARLGPGRGPRAVADAVACAALECAFDLGSAVAAVQLRRPGLLFTGFRRPR